MSSEQKNLLCIGCKRYFTGTGDLCPKCRRAHDTAKPSAHGVNPVTVNRRTPNANPNDGRLKG